MADDKYRYSSGENQGYDYSTEIHGGTPMGYEEKDVFGDEVDHQIRYRTLSWEMVAVLMIAEIGWYPFSNGMLSLPQAMATVGIVPGTILIIFLGVFATYTSWVLIQFKLRHPQVHNMGDAGYILFGTVGREVLAAGTVIFAVFATGSQLLAGQISLAALSDSKLCNLVYVAIFTAPTLILSFPRTLDSLSWLCIPACLSILIAGTATLTAYSDVLSFAYLILGVVGMIGAGLHPIRPRVVQATVHTDFYHAFSAITNPVFAYAGHFMFFILVSEMRKPQHAMKAAYTLQGFAYYVLFAIIMYVYLGSNVASPAFTSLPVKWAKAAYGIALPNFLIAGSLYSHTAAKLFFIRMFRRSRHLHEHTVLGWGVWTALIVLMNGAAFVLAVGVPIFSYLVGIAASLFASWYTYGIAGAFYLHTLYHDGGGGRGLRRNPLLTALNAATFVAGAFICVAGTYVNVKLIVDAYRAGTVGRAFGCG